MRRPPVPGCAGWARRPVGIGRVVILVGWVVILVGRVGGDKVAGRLDHDCCRLLHVADDYVHAVP